MKENGYSQDTFQDAQVGQKVTKTPKLLQSDYWRHIEDLLNQFEPKQQIMYILLIKQDNLPAKSERE